MEQIANANTNGIHSVYIDSGGTWQNTFDDNFIDWQADPGALTFANGSGLILNNRKLIAVDSDRTLLGFYFLPELMEGGLVRLAKYYSPRFKNRPPAAPGRPPGYVMGAALDVAKLDQYLRNLREFIR